ncbi:MAG TPA: sulfocyanin-like copper-binding protein [Mycobacteriales bacterium]
MAFRPRSRGLLTLVVVLLAAASTALIGGLVATNQARTTVAPSLTTCEPSHEASEVVQVGLSDAGGGMMGQAPMMLRLIPSPSSTFAGQVTFVATNYGALDHEFLVLPMPADGVGTRPVGSNGKINESQSLGEASTSCGAGPGNGISTGSRSWVTLTFRPGNYELLCDVAGHYADGMYASFTVS